MSFADTSNINLNVLLSSKYAAERLADQFIAAHRGREYLTPAISNGFSGSAKKKVITLKQFYEKIVIPTLRDEIYNKVFSQIEEQWKRKNKRIYRKRRAGRSETVINEPEPEFSKEVDNLVEKTKAKDKQWKRAIKEQTRVGCLWDVIVNGYVESCIPTDIDDEDTPSPPPPPPKPNPSPKPTERPCKTCSTKIKGKGDQCLACFRKWFIENRLKKIVGWNKLTPEEQEYYCEKVNQCKEVNKFRTLKQEVINAIQNKGDDDDKPGNPIHKIFLAAWDHDPELQKLIAKYGLSNNKNWFLSIANETFLKADRTINYDELEKFFQQNVSSKTCSECSKKFYGTCWTIGEGKSELFCSEGCAKNWQKKGPSDDSGEEIIEDDGNDLPINDPPVENNLPGENNDNSEPNNISNQDDTQLPSNIQSIASLPLPQAQIVAEQKIEKLLKDNNISKQELIQLAKTVFSGKSNWKDYLKSLDTPTKVAQFVNQMQQAILKMKLTNKTPNKDKNPKNGWILPVSILVVACLALTSLVLIVRKRRRRIWG